VKPLIALRFLSVSQCGNVASLAAIESLAQLETFYASGSTRIVDGDLAPLATLPRPTEIRMRNRRGYLPGGQRARGRAILITSRGCPRRRSAPQSSSR
jgi:internalin A